MKNGKDSKKKYYIVMGTIFIVAALFAGKGARKILARHKELKKVDKMITEQKAVGRRLKEEIILAKTDMMYLERLARKELGLIQPGEIEYRFIDPKGEKR